MMGVFAAVGPALACASTVLLLLLLLRRLLPAAPHPRHFELAVKSTICLPCRKSSRQQAAPGGPCSRTPLGGARPRRRNASACASGHSTACRSRRLTSARPPMSSQLTVRSHCTPRPGTIQQIFEQSRHTL